MKNTKKQKTIYYELIVDDVSIVLCMRKHYVLEARDNSLEYSKIENQEWKGDTLYVTTKESESFDREEAHG